MFKYVRHVHPPFSHIGDYPETTNLLVDHHTYYYDLAATIATQELAHRHGYSARRDLNLTSMFPTAWNEYVFRMARNRTLFCGFMYVRVGFPLSIPDPVVERVCVRFD